MSVRRKFALCAKAGSATVLQGGHEAADTK